MGFFDSVIGYAKQAKCAVGFHAGEYENVKGKPLCHFEKECPDCKEFMEKDNHKFPKEVEYHAEKSCVKIFKCVHCDETTSTEVHLDGVYLRKNSQCEVVKRCVRCDSSYEDGTSHDYPVIPRIEKISETEHHMIYECKDCGDEKIRKIKK